MTLTFIVLLWLVPGAPGSYGIECLPVARTPAAMQETHVYMDDNGTWSPASQDAHAQHISYCAARLGMRNPLERTKPLHVTP